MNNKQLLGIVPGSPWQLSVEARTAARYGNYNAELLEQCADAIDTLLEYIRQNEEPDALELGAAIRRLGLEKGKRV